MRINAFIISFITLALLGMAFNCMAKDEAMDNCVAKELRENNVVIGKDTISDPGGGKRKTAERNCEYERSKGKKEFTKKHANKK
jgi:hypothetical protein